MKLRIKKRLNNERDIIATVLGQFPWGKFPPTLIQTLILTQTVTLTGGQFSSEAIVRTHSNNDVLKERMKTILKNYVNEI